MHLLLFFFEWKTEGLATLSANRGRGAAPKCFAPVDFLCSGHTERTPDSAAIWAATHFAKWTHSTLMHRGHCRRLEWPGLLWSCWDQNEWHPDLSLPFKTQKGKREPSRLSVPRLLCPEGRGGGTTTTTTMTAMRVYSDWTDGFVALPEATCIVKIW